MANAATAVHRSPKKALPWILTPVLLLILSIGLVMMVYLLMPSHKLQSYLNLAFMDSLKVTSTTAGLNIVNKDIDTGDQRPTTDTGKIITPKFGEQYAKLVCDDIALTVSVYFGTTKELLALGACQSTQSAVLGNKDNVVISAHVNTYFADLDEMETGDIVVLYTEYGKFTYRVKEQIRFPKTDKRYIVPTGTDRLTLYTCEGDVLGDSDNRVGVICDLVSKEYFMPADE